VSIQQFLSGDSLRKALPTVIQKTWNFVRSSVGGFLGVFGFLLSLVIVPIYLYYLLVESRNISESWGDYVPLRASHFKDEVVETLEEINGYLIAFFRGQLLVSLINGAATGMGLVIVGLDFGLLLGLLLCVLGLIPYLGILLCWIPAVLIAALHGDPWFLQGAAWWAFPLIVTGIFVAVQQVDGIFLTPKIVGESVGLHPMTVIASVFVWSLLMGGLLGAILAVPMTATIKVLLKRYIWERRFLNGVDPRLATEESFSVQQAQHSVSERDL
jgi:predicted PurR-regulated permease PerM